MKLLLVCFLIAVVIVFPKLMRRSVGKKTAPDSIQAITQLAEEGNVQAQYELAGLFCNKEPKDYRKQAVACISTNSVRGCTTHPTCELRETSKPTCRVCAVRTHTCFGVQTIVSNFQTISNVV